MDPRQTAETFNTVQPILFWLVALATGFCAVATVIAQNIVRAATWLLFTLAGTSAVFFLLGADLVGATQLLVYVGGTLVLVIFGVMLTAQGPFVSMKTSGAEWAISVVAGFLLMAVLATAVLTPNVSMGPPLIKTMGVVRDGPKKGEKHVMYRTPEVKRYAPRYSRAERQSIGAASPARGGDNVMNKYAPGKGGVQGAPLQPPGGGGKKNDQKGAGGPPNGIGPGALPLPPGGGGEKKGPKVPGKPPQDMDKGLGGPPPAPQPGAVPPAVKPVDDMSGGSAESMKERPEPLDPATSAQSATLGQGFVGVPVGPAHPSGKAVVRTSYLLPFEIVSVHLLVVLIGAAYLARAKRRRGGLS